MLGGTMLGMGVGVGFRGVGWGCRLGRVAGWKRAGAPTRSLCRAGTRSRPLLDRCSDLETKRGNKMGKAGDKACQ